MVTKKFRRAWCTWERNWRKKGGGAYLGIRLHFPALVTHEKTDFPNKKWTEQTWWTWRLDFGLIVWTWGIHWRTRKFQEIEHVARMNKFFTDLEYLDAIYKGGDDGTG